MTIIRDVALILCANAACFSGGWLLFIVIGDVVHNLRHRTGVIEYRYAVLAVLFALALIGSGAFNFAEVWR